MLSTRLCLLLLGASADALRTTTATRLLCTRLAGSSQGAPVMSLTDKQVNLIRSTWAGVSELGLDAVGVLVPPRARPAPSLVHTLSRSAFPCERPQLFTNIFQAAPGAAALFSFGREPGFDPAGDLASNPALVKHGAGVVETVGAAVSLLDDLDTLGPVLVDLGVSRYSISNLGCTHSAPPQPTRRRREPSSR